VLTAAIQMIFLLITAPFVGSFLGVIAARLPEGRPITIRPSACRHCGHVLNPRVLVPLVSWTMSVVSWTMSGRRRRNWDARVDMPCSAAETAALLIAVWCIVVLPGPLVWVGAVLGAMLLTLAMIDNRHLLLPDRRTLQLAARGLLWSLASGRSGQPLRLQAPLAIRTSPVRRGMACLASRPPRFALKRCQTAIAET
jgi:leader peptidase (prepilin peptidase)/N-methyltransferase